jgi:multiple sugar transport system substrate-binding protein
MRAAAWCLMLVAAAGCTFREPALPPDEAFAEAAERIQVVLDRESMPALPPPAQAPAGAPADANRLEVWTMEHAIMGPALSEGPARDALRAACPGVEVRVQHLGRWQVAVQKLAISLMAEELPDVAVLDRSWLGRLAYGGRIIPLEELLPVAMLDDLRPTAFRTGAIEGRLYALPADGFCSVLMGRPGFWRGDPPETLADLRALSANLSEAGPETRYVAGHLPYLEVFWSAGGQVVDDGECVLAEGPAVEVFEAVAALRDDGLLPRSGFIDPRRGLSAFLRGEAAATVAHSGVLPQVEQAGIEAALAPVPGARGPISRTGESVIVVFAQAAGKGEAVAALLDYLTGAEVQGEAAAALGSAPVRRSVASGVRPGLSEAYRVARAAPPIPAWNPVEFELMRHIARAWRWEAP